MPAHDPGRQTFREELWRIIFLSDTRAGRAFDVILLIAILSSVLVVTLESVEDLRSRHERLFFTLEWIFTGLFTLEYAARLWVAKKRRRYALSFFGIVDLIAVLPAYLELFLPGSHYLMAVRVLRLMRVFRVFKMAEYLGEAGLLLNALKASRRKIQLFFTAVLALVLVEGTVVYVFERETNPDFANIPQAIYWAIVTLTTVGYGDVAPVTVPGKMMASVIMLTGFAIIAVPTGVITSEIREQSLRNQRRKRRCRECGWDEHDPRALCCQQCGVRLE